MSVFPIADPSGVPAFIVKGKFVGSFADPADAPPATKFISTVCSMEILWGGASTTLLSAILFVWLWRDMKRANRYRKALELAKTKAETLMQRREQLLLTISHDIKAPINTILGYLHMLTPAAANARSYEAIGASATHLKRLVTDLLDYHKLEAGGIVLTCDTINVYTYIDNIVRAFTPLAQAKQL